MAVTKKTKLTQVIKPERRAKAKVHNYRAFYANENRPFSDPLPNSIRKDSMWQSIKISAGES